MDSSSSYSRRRDLLGGAGVDEDDDLEEGEYVPGRDDEPYRFHGAPLPERLRSRTPSSCESDGTISDDPSPAGSSVLTAEAAAAARRFVCHVCGTAFRSSKAVDGHMRVYGNGRQVSPAAVSGWAATGKRGWIGGKPSLVSMAMVSRNNSESTNDHSTAIVSVRPLEPTPIAMTNLSTRTNLFGDESSTSTASAEPMNRDAMPTVVSESSNNPSSNGEDQLAHHPVHQLPAVPPLATQHAQSIIQLPLAPPPAAHQPRREYSCKLCGKSYATHQGLGGHAAGHRNRQKEAEAAAAAGMAMMGGDAGEFLAALRRGGRKEEAPHECQKCHKVFATGVALGGHMRMHYTGPPIVHKKSKKRCLAPLPPPAAFAVNGGANLRLGLSSIKEESSPAPTVGSGRVRLFGIDIGLPIQEPAEEEQGSGTAAGEQK